MKKIYTTLVLFFCITQLYSQTVFSDNFNISRGTTYSVANGAIGTSTIWNMNRSGADWGARIDGNILDCTNDGSATANANGWIFANTSTAAFSSPYNTTLNLNTTTITWTFNMRQIRPDPAGFGVGSYGVACVLAGSSNNPASGSTGYAVALGQSGATDPIRLIKYNNGVQGAIADIIVSNTTGLTDFGADYLSIKVTYVPSSNTWELFVRNDGTTAFADPAVGTLTSQGSAVDNTFTGQNLGFLGGYWQGATAASQTAFFDNINVSLASSNSSNSDIISNTGFTTPSNINYALYQGTVLTLANSIEVADFTLRDGGAAADADALGTTLTDISFSLTNSANVRRVAIMDGTTQLQELAGAATLNFTGLNLTAADNSTKNFSLRVVFANNVTDNQQFQFAITSATAAFAGSQFATTNAGGASSSITSDNNRVEVIADGLTYLTNTFSPTGNGVAMAPAVQLGGTDTLNFNATLYTNLDLDFTEQVSITSTGTLTGSPVIVAAIAGIANFPSLIHTVNGTAFTLNAERTTTADWDVTSNPFDIVNSSSATDYFRSIQNGNWNNPTTWESSANNLAWQSSTLTPTSAAQNITIQTGDTVTITANTSADQLRIENGAMLIHNNAVVFTIDNGAALYDMIIDIGGTYTLNGRQPVGLGSIVVNGGGHVRIASNPTPAEGDDFAFGNVGGVANVVFLTGSFYDWAASGSTPSWTNRTYFTAGNITYYRFLVSPNFSLGGGSPTIIHGVLQADAPITIVGTATKTFVNGIINAAQIDASFATGGSINITGNNAEVGDIGTVLLPPAGLNIGPNTNVSSTTSPLTPTKTLNGNVSFGANTFYYLTDTDLTITGNLTGTSSTAFFLTNGLSNAGKLIRPNVGATPVFFPIGTNTSSYNPVTISNGDNLAYGVKVFIGINPPIFDDVKAILRTWLIKPLNSTPSAPVNVTFNYDNTMGNTGFNYSANVEVGLYTNVWNIIQSNITPTGSYNVTANVSNFGANIEAPMVIANLGAILSISKKINLEIKRVNNSNRLMWLAVGLNNAKQFELEYSLNGIVFSTKATLSANTFNYTDVSAYSTKIYYRLKCIDNLGVVFYSNVVSIENDNKSSFVTIAPNIVSDNLNLIFNSIDEQKISLTIINSAGQKIYSSDYQIKKGNSKISIPTNNIDKGFYTVSILSNKQPPTIQKFIK